MFRSSESWDSAISPSFCIKLASFRGPAPPDLLPRIGSLLTDSQTGFAGRRGGQRPDKSPATGVVRPAPPSKTFGMWPVCHPAEAGTELQERTVGVVTRPYVTRAAITIASSSWLTV